MGKLARSICFIHAFFVSSLRFLWYASAWLRIYWYVRFSMSCRAVHYGRRDRQISHNLFLQCKSSWTLKTRRYYYACPRGRAWASMLETNAIDPYYETGVLFTVRSILDRRTSSCISGSATCAGSTTEDTLNHVSYRSPYKRLRPIDTFRRPSMPPWDGGMRRPAHARPLRPED